jgi:hypothetical protein
VILAARSAALKTVQSARSATAAVLAVRVRRRISVTARTDLSSVSSTVIDRIDRCVREIFDKR